MQKALDIAPRAEHAASARRSSFRKLGARRGSVRDGRRRRASCGSDTFNNYFHPETSQAALDVLQRRRLSACSFRRTGLCCGRPLYDFGFLDQAKQYLRTILDGARGPPIDAGMPIVVLEPSCASVFRDELRNLLPDDARAERLRAADVSAERVSRAPGARLSAAAARREGRCSTATAITKRS